MRVLIFHGYLLRGTGSNVYNASLAPALARLGHEVHLLCQDRAAGELDWVDSVGGEGRPGAVTVHVPEIGGLLPVYVLDSYEGFEVQAFSELDVAELDRYLQANVAAVTDVIARAGPPDAALANHLVMGPAILARAGLRFAAKVHGSALEYTVKADPERFLPFAREGMEAASAVLVGSRHTAESLWEAIDMPALPAKTRLGPPGVDTTLFSPIPPEEGRDRLRDLAVDVRTGLGGELGEDETAHPRVARTGAFPEAELSGRKSGDAPARRQDPRPSAWGRNPEQASAAIDWFADAEGPRVVFVGKLIVSKGVDLLLAAWPLAATRNPGARLLLVGFGEYRDGLDRLWRALGAGDHADATEIAARGRALEGGPESRLRMLASFLKAPPAGYAEAAAAAADSVRFSGRLEHDEVGRLLPATEALVFPSTFPEAFGMVAAEAAAAGVLPVSADHSGLAEVSRELAGALEPDLRELVSFELGTGAVAAIAGRLDRWLATDELTRERARAALAETAAGLWGWEGVARGVIAASQGRIDELAQVPAGR
ncbi:MAG: glycosyltransferase [bacterium]